MFYSKKLFVPLDWRHRDLTLINWWITFILQLLICHLLLSLLEKQGAKANYGIDKTVYAICQMLTCRTSNPPFISVSSSLLYDLQTSEQFGQKIGYNSWDTVSKSAWEATALNPWKACQSEHKRHWNLWDPAPALIEPPFNLMLNWCLF